MKTIYLAILLGLLSSACTSMRLAPAQERQKSYTIENKLKKDQSFDRLQSWAAQNTGPKAVRLNDRVAGNIVIQANTACRALKLGNGFATSDEILEFVLNIQVKDKVVVADFTNIVATSYGVYDSGLRPSSQQEIQTVVSECIEPLKQDIVSVLK